VIPLRLDRRVPFIDAVFRVMDDGAPLQTAIDTLAQAETAARIHIVGGPIDTWIDGVCSLRADVPTPSLVELVRLCTDSTAFDTMFEPPSEALDEIYGPVLFRLLDHTHLMLTGGDFCNDYNFIIDGRTVAGPGTWRVWGELVATWANQRGLIRPHGIGTARHARRQRAWEYTDFYMRTYVNETIADFDRWADTVLAVLAEKNRQLAGLAGIPPL
jgi:hypothetical protein